MSLFRSAISIVLSAAAVSSVMNAQSSGTYQMDGGSYTITVEFGQNELIVVEPNKRSTYRRVGSTQEYRFFNENTGSTFALTVIDDRTLRASRVPETVRPNILRLVSATAAVAAVSETDRFKAIADRYRLLAEGDTDNTQMWTFCAAAALGWAMKPEAEAAAYAWRVVQQVKPIAVDASRSPCPDVISGDLWISTAAPAERSPLARAPQPAARAGRTASAAPASSLTQAPTAGAGGMRDESPETAAARERAEQTTAAATAANAVVREQDARLMGALGSLVRTEAEAGAATVLAGGTASSASAASSMALLLPTPDQWLNVWKDFRARRAAIDAQNAYVAQLRRDRLATGAPDVQGFKVPLRPSPTDIVDEAQKARVTGIGIVPQFDPGQRSYWLQQLSTIGKSTGDSSFFAYSWRTTPNPQDWLPGFSARLVSNAISLQFTLESTEARLRPYQSVRCVVYGPDGARMGQTDALGVASRRRLTEEQEFEVIIIARTWRPGTYGIECGPMFSNPWVNLTFDVTA